VKATSRRLIVNSLAMLGLSVLQRGLGLISITILARLLDQRGLGAFAFTQSTSQAFFGMARLGADAGMHVGMANIKLPDDTAKAQALLGEGMSIFVLVAVLVSALMVCLAEHVAGHLFAAPELAAFILPAAALFVAQVANQYCYAVLAGLNAFVTYSRVALIGSVVSLLLATTGGLIGGALGAAWGLAAGAGFAALYLAAGLRGELTKLGLSARPRLPSTQATALLRLGFPFYAGGLLLIPVDFFCAGLLSQTAGVAALGDLRVTQAVVAIATALPISLSGPLISYFAGRSDVKTRPDAILLQLKIVWVLSLGLAIVLASIWPLAVDLVFGGSFAQARSAGILALAAFIPTMLTTVLAGALLAMKRSGKLLCIGAIQAVALAACAAPLIGGYGLGGLLSAQAVGMTVGVVASSAVLARRYETSIFRIWMIPLAMLTIALIALLFVDARTASTLPVRFSVALALLALLAATVPALVLSADERHRLIALARDCTTWLATQLRRERATDAAE
jgi:O-antigen/teichoic acid export membrane protein